MKRKQFILGMFLTVLFLTGCTTQPKTTVTIVMWGGNEQVNQYMDDWVAPAVLDKHDITLRRVPMNAPEFMAKFMNEKREEIETGTADLVWINGENFRTAREGELLWGPFTHLLENQATYVDQSAPDLHHDTGIPIEGYQALWGRAQLTLAYDSAIVSQPPRSYKELLVWAKSNPGMFTYPNPVDDFVGAAFVRSAYYELTGLEEDELTREMSKEKLREISQPVIDYFLELQPYLWRQGKAYPASQSQLDDFFRSGETAFSMGFEVGKVLGLIQEGVFPETVETLVFESGSIGNSHYLAIPFNAQEKEGALLVIDFLQSPEAQIEKFKPEVWGDMPAFDPALLSEIHQQQLLEIETQPGMPSLESLAQYRLLEMHAQTIDWIKEIWAEEVGGR